MIAQPPVIALISSKALTLTCIVDIHTATGNIIVAPQMLHKL